MSNTFYVGTRKPDAATFRLFLDRYVAGWAEDIATVLRSTGAYAEVRVFPADAVDRLIASGAVPTTSG